jgi:hypothetical protein
MDAARVKEVTGGMLAPSFQGGAAFGPELFRERRQIVIQTFSR